MVWGPWGPFLGYIILYISKRVPKVPRRNSAVKRSPEVPRSPQGPQLRVRSPEAAIKNSYGFDPRRMQLKTKTYNVWSGTFFRHHC